MHTKSPQNRGNRSVTHYLAKMFNKIVNPLTQIDSKMYLLSYGKLLQFGPFYILHFTLPPPHSDPIGKILVY